MQDIKQKKMKIPDKIELLGSIIKTVYDQQLLEEFKQVAQHNSAFNEIRLKKRHEDRIFDGDILFENYIHELVHAMLTKLKYDKLNDNEQFIEQFSNLLVQVLKQLK